MNLIFQNPIFKALVPVALFSTLALTTAAQAAPPTHPINHRRNEQQQRIDQGLRSGSLTPRETVRLEHREGRIAHQEARDRRSGGHFTAAERRHIEREENRTSRAIYRQKHDAQHDRYFHH